MPNGRPRRRSIFSGLLLILLGVLFLWHNFRGGYEIWRLLGTWWPVLLILWGLAKLYDHLVARRTGETAPPTISGGDILLVILVLALAGAVAVGDLIHHPGGKINAGIRLPWEHSYDFSEELPVRTVAPNASITVSTDYGDITVRPEDTSEVRALARKMVVSSSEAEAQRRAGQVQVEVVPLDHGYEVRTRNQGGAVQVNLEIHVPRKTSITARTPRGNLEIKGIAGNVTAEAQRGSVEIRDTGGDVSLQTQRGDTHVVGAGGNVKVSGGGGEVEVSNVKGEAVVNGEFYGPIRIEKVTKGARFVSRRSDLTVSQLSGRMEIGSGRLEITDAPGNVSLVTSKKDIAFDNVTGRVHIENRDGNIELRFSQPPREPIEVSNASGNIEITLPPNSSFAVSAESRSGEIDCEWEEIAKQAAQDRNTTKLEGKVGGRGPLLKLRTSYGTISLHKGQ